MTDEEFDQMVEDIRNDRQCSEYCGWCNTRHHPNQPCQEDEE
jgi:predicted 3-demethylubiquinone-9 3-methyltransferase (glyoxalase superfamily)